MRSVVQRAFFAVVLAACGAGTPGAEQGSPDGSTLALDAGQAGPDAGAHDSGVAATDAGSRLSADAGSPDAGGSSAGASADAGLVDAGRPSVDAGQPSGDCTLASVRCVGATREYATIQAATNAATAGDTVLVFAGHYRGFQIRASGEPGRPIVFRAADTNVIIDSAIVSGSGILSDCTDAPTGICIVGVGDLEGLHDLVVENFRIENMGKRCVASHQANPGFIGTSSPHQRITLRGLICVNAGHEGLYLSELYDSLIENNEVLNAGADGTDRGHGIYLANAGCDKTVIRGNFIHWEGKVGPPEGAGIHFNGDSSVDGNGGGDGLITGLVVENNIIRGSGHNGLNMDGVQRSIIRNNVILANARNSIVVYAIDAAAGAKDLIIVNNTFVVPASSSGAAIKLEQDLGGHTLFNNVLVNLSSGPAISVANGSFTSDFNVTMGTFEIDSSTVSASAWNTAGHDTHSHVSTGPALFVTATDFHAKNGALSIDRGTGSVGSVSAPTSDADGIARPQGDQIDIGAYER